MTTFASMPVRGSLRSRREEGAEVREQAPVQKHVSVMTREVLAALEPKAGETVVDATYGQGGHSATLKKAAKIKLISIDADPDVETSSHNGAGPVIVGNFADLTAILKKLDIEKVNKVLFDLGWNRGQLSSGRGFSFLNDEPLNMSYAAAPRSGFTAAEILNEWSETVLADVFFGYGEERYARRIAKAVVARRKVKPFETTIELAEAVRDAVPPAYRRGRIHPATKTFQALRIAVNDELGVLDQGLKAAWTALAEGGRIAVITFHSIEDRAVKRYFVSLAKAPPAGGQGGKLIYKKPLAPTAAEVKANPASRSAKLRAIEKICTY